MRLILLLSMSLALPGRADAQVEDRLLAGMRARITRGGIWPPVAANLRDTTIALYPGVRFVYADIQMEHGGRFRMYEAIDSTGQLYLLDSPASFRLLHSEHFQGSVDSTAALTIALLAARFGGQLPAEFKLLEQRSFLMVATRGDGGRVPFFWNVFFDAEFGGQPTSLEYWIHIPDGIPMLMSRDCDIWCRTTILEH